MARALAHISRTPWTMYRLYIRTQDGSGEHFNVDVYEPTVPVPDTTDAAEADQRGSAAVVIVIGGAGKAASSGSPSAGKHAAAYHDAAIELSAAGLWVFVPSRRGDPTRSPNLRSQVVEPFRHRLPHALFVDEGPNEGLHTHERQVAELEALIRVIPERFHPSVQPFRFGLLGKSAGAGVALRVAAQLPNEVAAVALWGAAKHPSSWFSGPDAAAVFSDVLAARGVRYDRPSFINEICDAADHIGRVAVPLLLACGAPDPEAAPPTEPDKWTSPAEQLELLGMARRSRYARVAVVKGAEHTMYREHAAWLNYASLLRGWFIETLDAPGVPA